MGVAPGCAVSAASWRAGTAGSLAAIAARWAARARGGAADTLVGLLPGSREGVRFLSGTEIAHWLFWHTKTTGTCHPPAKFRASWKSPSEVAPSPKYAMTTTSSPRYWAA